MPSHALSCCTHVDLNLILLSLQDLMHLLQVPLTQHPPRTLYEPDTKIFLV